MACIPRRGRFKPSRLLTRPRANTPERQSGVCVHWPKSHCAMCAQVTYARRWLKLMSDWRRRGLGASGHGVWPRHRISSQIGGVSTAKVRRQLLAAAIAEWYPDHLFPNGFGSRDAPQAEPRHALRPCRRQRTRTTSVALDRWRPRRRRNGPLRNTRGSRSQTWYLEPIRFAANSWLRGLTWLSPRRCLPRRDTAIRSQSSHQAIGQS